MSEAILFFSVSNAMTQIARKIIMGMRQNIVLVSGDKSTALEIAASHPDCNTYIGRGGTAELLRTVPGKAVVELSTSLEEVLDAVQTIASKGAKNIGVVVPKAILNGINKDYRLFGGMLYIRSFTGSDLDSILMDMKHKGVRGIVVNGSAVEKAQKMGFDVEILNNGVSSIKQAIDRALEIERNAAYERERQHDHLRQIQQYSAKLNGAVDQAFSAVKELEDSSQKLAQVCEQAATVSQTAYKHMHATKEVISMVKKIADQTAILGVNGAIESARAGAAGKGFAVITHEIRQLATESNRAVTQIDKDLQLLQSSMDSVVTSVSQCNEISKLQAKENTNITDMLKNLTDAGHEMVAFMDGKRQTTSAVV